MDLEALPAEEDRAIKRRRLSGSGRAELTAGKSFCLLLCETTSYGLGKLLSMEQKRDKIGDLLPLATIKVSNVYLKVLACEPAEGSGSASESDSEASTESA